MVLLVKSARFAMYSLNPFFGFRHFVFLAKVSNCYQGRSRGLSGRPASGGHVGAVARRPSAEPHRSSGRNHATSPLRILHATVSAAATSTEPPPRDDAQVPAALLRIRSRTRIYHADCKAIHPLCKCLNSPDSGHT